MKITKSIISHTLNDVSTDLEDSLDNKVNQQKVSNPDYIERYMQDIKDMENAAICLIQINNLLNPGYT